ncbi:MAG: NAD(+) synthase [Treponema sp.]|nr:NAD(+) synthase [Treponema sp.]
MYGFIRTACCSPNVTVANSHRNGEEIVKKIMEASKNGAYIIVCPELCITGYTSGDLFFQKSLQISAVEVLSYIAKNTKGSDALIFVGLPVLQNDGIYNCAAVLYHGKVLALVPKSYIPNYSEFYERRQFTPFRGDTRFVDLSSELTDIPMGTNILFQDEKNPEISVACEICEDLWVPLPPSVKHTLSGATIIANLSAGNEIIGKSDYRKNLVMSRSASSICAYLYANAGKGESTQDMVFSGHNLICENGICLSESALFSNQIIYADIDVERLCQERRHTTTFSDCACQVDSGEYLVVKIDLLSKQNINDFEKNFSRYVDSHPFVPENKLKRTERCKAVINLQAEALAKRLKHINCRSAVIGLSGGLDSTLALLVTARAFDLTGIPRNLISAVTMPCFGTTDRTYNNACALAKVVGADLLEIKISESVRLHMKDIGQDENVHDVTYENCQARERTQVLMDIANKTNGIVIGTGDLSELALGWCTYNGDHMSMYGVNSSIPKTLVRYLVEWFCEDSQNVEYSAVLRDILDTPVSPELLPPQDGKITQKTEDLVGPYELHDFYLYYHLRFGFSAQKIFFLSEKAGFTYDAETRKKWLIKFYKRFFSQQFKRSCMPDGAKVGSVNLSPRGDWRMPSDADGIDWISDINNF